MPLYEYECDACGHRFEVIRKFSDPPVEACVSCGGAVRKLFSSPAIHFKGSGWYITDYARKGARDTETPTEKAEKAEAEKAEKSEKSDKGDKVAAAPSGAASRDESAPRSEPTPSSSPASGPTGSGSKTD